MSQVDCVISDTDRAAVTASVVCYNGQSPSHITDILPATAPPTLLSLDENKAHRESIMCL